MERTKYIFWLIYWSSVLGSNLRYVTQVEKGLEQVTSMATQLISRCRRAVDKTWELEPNMI